MGNVISALLYYLILLPISLLPFPVMYLVSDLFFIILYYIFPYRKKLVMKNLRNSFPEKSEKEIAVITKEFYKHFCDIVFETLKVFTVSPTNLGKRIELENTQLLKDLYAKGKSVIVVTGHYSNWEWPAVTFSKHSLHKASGIYAALSNKFFDAKLRSTRARFGTQLMSTREVHEFFEKTKNELYTYGFINDQSPSKPEKGHWMKFLNQDTCMLLGAEKYAVQYNFPVVYGKITKIRRGYYKLSYELVSENPASEKPFAITEKCSHINEALIKAQPQFWLWTHRRWKHKFVKASYNIPV
jgi:KDO2-lipid IV(A) lauroyltransferase